MMDSTTQMLKLLAGNYIIPHLVHGQEITLALIKVSGLMMLLALVKKEVINNAITHNGDSIIVILQLNAYSFSAQMEVLILILDN